MLQIKDIRKQYITGELVQTALDGVSLTLRDCEFVAILGPSGSGKTTMLNVIGGLDRYDSGDLIINGISTKKYSDRDWDSYRNHTIGFVFQSYNLIPHQTVLANVELALTISGISPSERKRRAAKALEDVGLGNQLHKKPNQMSGGQMQRVAIARALVNNPDILLADEPTGALDSETSVQVMELLKEVSKDRLVVMVTHNPELAEEYANRIVRVKDGRIVDDTNPYIIDTDNQEPPQHKNMGRSSMSFFTALSLSFNNLATKKARTLLTAFAGSIGIIGIALIMSLSTGFQKYIDKIQEDTLSNYPLTIQTETADMGAAMAAFGSSIAQAEELDPGIVGEQQMISQMFSQIGTNDLKSFKEHLTTHYSEISDTINAIKYSYGVKPRIYSASEDKILQVNPASLFGDLTGSSAMSAYMDSDIFYEMMDNLELLSSQYDVLQGKWPENYDEMVVVLSDPNQISDYIAYSLGLKDPTDLNAMIEKVMNGEEPDDAGDPMQWSYDELMALRFRLVNASDTYRFNNEYQVWEDMSDSEAFMRNLIDQGEELKIVGIVCPKEGVSTSALTPGIAYTSDLTMRVISAAKDSPIVSSQLNNMEYDVFTGNRFDAENESSLNFENMISVDGDALSSSFGINIDEAVIMAMLNDYLTANAETIIPDTSAAQTAFKDTFISLASEMLHGYISANINATSGKAHIYLSQIEGIVDGYLATQGAASKISQIAQAYSMPAEAFEEVYRPLLVGVTTGLIGENLQAEPSLPPIPDIPQIPEIPDITLPTLPDTVPDNTTPSTPTDPVDPDNSNPDGTQNPDSSNPNTPPSSDDTSPDTPSNPDDTGSGDPPAPDISDPDNTPESGDNTPESGNNIPDTNTPDEGDTPEPGPDANTLSGAQAPSVRLLATVTPLDSEDSGSQPVVDASKVFGAVTTGMADDYIVRFASDSLVSGTAAAMSTQMLETEITDSLITHLGAFSNILMGYMGNAFYVNEDQIASAFQFNMNEEDLRRLMDAMSGTQEHSAASNLKSLGYADPDVPTSISIYMTDFAGKGKFLDFLDTYNADMETAGKEDQVISYTDITGIMMSSVRTIIDSVSYVLIAFVAVSLVVSSIMIGIITYISVMERTKEIGVLRAIGASKQNISQVFNAETFIIGLCSGLIGVGITILLNFPINQIIYSLTDNPDINAQLPFMNALILILLSMVLTLIGGLIPSRQAAKKDPVIALRSE